MYFSNRAAAGRMLADKLLKYEPQHIVVLSLGVSSVIVAAQVAMKLHANLLLYLTREVHLPGEIDALAGMGSGDIFTYNDHYTMSEIEDYVAEYRSYIDQKRIENAHEMHLILGDDGEIDKDLLRHRTIILVADGLVDGFTLRIAAEFLKTVAIKRLVVACPVASVAAVDKMHLYSDEICCLWVTDNYLGSDHYYDDNTVPNMEGVLKIMRNISMNWERPLAQVPVVSGAVPATAPTYTLQPKAS